MQLDRFSQIADGYARYRPRYPEAMYRWILKNVRERNHAWDVGTGNGQVASALAPYFTKVTGTDISAAQLSHAFRAANISYHASPAEDSPITSGSVDLITVAQAAHWFQMNSFVQEVDRVSRDGALLAIWGYSLFESEPRIDKIIRYLYDDILQGFWDPHRELIDHCYADLHLPFTELPSPGFQMQNIWSAGDVIGYLRTWSAVGKYVVTTGEDPVVKIEQDILNAFDGRQVHYKTSIFLRMWRIQTAHPMHISGG